jgi:hypothetical protein
MKSLTAIIAVILLIASFSAIGLSKENNIYEAEVSKTISYDYLNPIISEYQFDYEKYTQISMVESFGYINHEGEPILPRSIQTFELPFGTRVTSINCEISSIETYEIENIVLPAPEKVITGYEDEKLSYIPKSSIYSKDELYPNNWYSIHTGAGLNSNLEHTTFVTIQTYPVRYNPQLNQIHVADDINLKITYQEPLEPLLPINSEYDLVIITPSQFTSTLQSLVDHKNSHGIQTTVKTTEEIYSQYTGVDKPEQIKYYIKDAVETMGVTYVLLVGGLKSPIIGTPRDDENQGTMDWLLPVRYTNNREAGGTYDPGFISDLYYADLYNATGEFETWDKDRYGESDGVFAVWRVFASAKDIIDLYPDVIVGRLACRNDFEVQIMVDKIIEYETTTYGASWFDRMIGIGGDSHDDSGTNYNEGEVACDYIFENYMTEFTPIKLYASYRTSDPQHVPSSENIIRDITAGSGFLLFEGHGHPGSWNTHWPGDFTWSDTPGGANCYDFFKFKNDGKYPICVIGGCHNSQFNITLINTILERPFMWTHGQPYAESFSWHMARKINGGSIASFGNTGLGYGAVGNHGDLDGDGVNNPDTVEAVGGYQIVTFFKTIDEGVEFLGEAWLGAETKYLNTYPGMDDQTDCKTVEQWPILGDPTLKIGGYS